MKRRFGANLNIGTSSLLLIFIVLSLVSFAVLSLSSALSDEMMINNVLDRSTNYYDACSQAEHTLAGINEDLLAEYEQGEFTESEKDFYVTISETQDLNVAYVTHVPDENGYLYTVTEWKVVNTAIPEIDNSMPALMQ